MERDSETQFDTTRSIDKRGDDRLRIPAGLGVAGVTLAILLVVLAGGGMMMGPGMMLGGPLLLVGLVVLVGWLLRGNQLTDVISAWDRPRSESTRSESARDILDARYARGEVSDDEYDRMRHKLE